MQHEPERVTVARIGAQATAADTHRGPHAAAQLGTGSGDSSRTGSGDRFKDFRGTLTGLQGREQAMRERVNLQGKRASKRFSRVA